MTDITPSPRFEKSTESPRLEKKLTQALDILLVGCESQTDATLEEIEKMIQKTQTRILNSTKLVKCEPMRLKLKLYKIQPGVTDNDSDYINLLSHLSQFSTNDTINFAKSRIFSLDSGDEFRLVKPNPKLFTVSTITKPTTLVDNVRVIPIRDSVHVHVKEGKIEY